MNNLYNVIIIGAGNIGALFDEPSSEKVLTHAHAFLSHEGFNLLGFLDVNEEKSRKAVSIWSGKVYSSLVDKFSLDKIDVVSVAVPDEYHYQILKELSKFPVKIVFAEKPLTKTLQEAEEISELYKKNNIPVVINYSRRFLPEIQKIKENIENGIYGNYVTGTGYYGKGIIHNGSHLIDLLRYLNLDIKKILPLDSISDFYEDDKSISAVLIFERNKPFYLQYIDCRLYTMFEIDILFERRRIRLIDSGFRIEEYEIQEDRIFKGYRKFTKVDDISTSLDKSLYSAVDNIYSYLTKGEKLYCLLEDGYKALETCIKIRERIK